MNIPAPFPFTSISVPELNNRSELTRWLYQHRGIQYAGTASVISILAVRSQQDGISNRNITDLHIYFIGSRVI